MRLGCARPVRSFFRSAWKFCTHFTMRVAASFLRSSSMGRSPRCSAGSLERHGRTHVLAAYDAGEIPGIVQIEHPQRQAVVAAHDDGGGIHDVELLAQYTDEGEARVRTGGRIAQRIIRLYAVHLGGLQQYVGVDLDGAQRGGGVGGEERSEEH